MRMTLNALLVGSALLAGSAFVTPVEAATQTVLYTFCSQASCSDGSIPSATLLKSGNYLYGVTQNGGANGHGVVFRYSVTGGSYKVLYNFCSSTNIRGYCSDGDNAGAKLIIDTSGNLYGETYYGGLSNAGLVFKLNKPTGTGPWTFSTIHAFCANCADGNGPVGGLSYAGAASGTAYNGSSLLFGETIAGGGGGVGGQGTGTVFVLSVSGGAWSEKVAESFCPTCGLGQEPYGGLYVDTSENLWGTTLEGGTTNNGLAFKLVPGTDHFNDPWTESTLYNFCWNSATNCPDGSGPLGVTVDASGNLFGTAGGGDASGDGVLFKLTNTGCTEGGVTTFWCNSVKHTFCSSTGCADGADPNGDLAIDSSGVVYGTTSAGGSSAIVSGGAGTTWKVNGTTETVLHKFCQSSGCADGQGPTSGVVLDSSNDLFGDTPKGGDALNGDGVLFEYTP